MKKDQSHVIAEELMEFSLKCASLLEIKMVYTVNLALHLQILLHIYLECVWYFSNL